MKGVSFWSKVPNTRGEAFPYKTLWNTPSPWVNTMLLMSKRYLRIRVLLLILTAKASHLTDSVNKLQFNALLR